MTRNRTVLDKQQWQSANASIASSTVAFALNQGLTLDQISAATGVNGHDLVDPSLRLPERLMPEVWTLLVKQVPSDEPLTMRMAEAAPLSFFADIAHGVRFTDTIGEAVDLLIKYRRILSDRVDIELVPSVGEVAVVVTHPLDHLDQGRTAEVGLALAWRLIEQLAADPVRPVRIEFSHAPTGKIEGYRKVFGAEPVFEAVRSALVFGPNAMNCSVNGGNSELLGYVRDHLSALLSKLGHGERPDPFDALRLAATRSSETGEYGPRVVAERAGYSYRQAQRLVATRGMTLRGLIEENRLALACDFLSEGKRTMEEIALALGYADDRAFRRAFKRRYLVSPSEFRSRQRG